MDACLESKRREKRKVETVFEYFWIEIRTASNSLGAILFSSMYDGECDRSIVHFHRSTSCNIFTARDQERNEVCKASDMLWILIPAKVVHPSLLDMPMTRIIRMYIRVDIYIYTHIYNTYTTKLSFFQTEILAITWQMDVFRWRLHYFLQKNEKREIIASIILHFPLRVVKTIYLSFEQSPEWSPLVV